MNTLATVGFPLQRLLAFRQAVYEQGLTRRRDAQFEVLDALLLGSAMRSFPELSCLPVFRRRWPSVYAALEDGRQNTVWLQQYLTSHFPVSGIQVVALDGAAWPRPSASTLPDRQYVYSPTKTVNGSSVVIGSPYSLLSWVAEPESSWALPLDIERIPSQQDALTVGVAQVKRLCHHRQEHLDTCLHIVVADAKYGTHHFLGPLRDVRCGVLVRLRRDRVLYHAPGSYRGRGRPAHHGKRFVFKDTLTWGTPNATFQGEDRSWGQVEIQAWEHLHAREASDTPFVVLRIQVHGEHPCPPAALWLSWQGPHQPLEVLWQAYHRRWTIEPSIRTRKQHLAWTLPQFHTHATCDRWTILVSLAHWMLFLARPLVQDHPLPWQARRVALTPKRVQQGWGVLSPSWELRQLHLNRAELLLDGPPDANAPIHHTILWSKKKKPPGKRKKAS